MKLSALAIALVYFVSSALLASDSASEVPPIPADIKPAGGMIVDNYDQGNYLGPFQDKLGSTVQAEVVRHALGPGYRFLQLRYSLHEGGYCGVWHKIGMSWNKTEDWSKVRALSFLAYTDRPVEIQFSFKRDKQPSVVARARLDSPGKWVAVTIPVTDWQHVDGALGSFNEFLLNINSPGPAIAGTVALDEIRVTGPGIADEPTPPIELDPKVIFAKSLTSPAAVSHKTYFVSPSGDDRASGDAEHPFGTIQHAADLVLPGDTVLLTSGTFTLQKGIVIHHGGSPRAWVTFAAAPGAHPVIDAPTAWSAIDVRETAYVEIRDLEVTTLPNPIVGKNEGHNGISGNYSHHLRFIGDIIHDCDGGGVGTGFCDYVTIENCRVYNNAYHNIWNCSGISLWEGRDFDNAPGYHNIIRGNVSYHNQNKGPTPMYDGKLTDGNGIIYDTCRGQAATLIEYNICFDNGGRGIHALNSDNITIRNNTVYQNGQTHGDPDLRAPGCAGVIIENNIIVGRPDTVFDQDDELAKNLVYRNNFLFGYKAVTDPPVLADPTNRIGIDPKFIHPALDPRTADFHLQTDSPAIGAGAYATSTLK